VYGGVAIGPVVGAAQGFARDGHDFTLKRLGKLLHPAGEEVMETLGSSLAMRRLKVSWEGMPLGRSRNCLNQSSLERPYSATWVQESAPLTRAQMAIMRISWSKCRVL